jgi:hypothetical protein
VRGVDGLVHRDQNNRHHGYYVNTQGPEQGLGSQRKIFSAEMSAALSGDDLVCFEQGEDGARILEAELFGLYVNWSERALIFSYVRVM